MKAYVKPELFYERFELSKHIADCALEFKNSANVNDCYLNADPDFNLGLGTTNYFMETARGCEIPLDYYCYTDGGDGFNTFVS